MRLRDRVKELRRVPASQLRANPKNWRRHNKSQTAALQAVLNEIGFAGALIARETPDGLTLIDGHLRTSVAGNEEIPVLVVDLNEEEADKLLLTYDPIAAMADADADALKSLMDSWNTDDPAIQELFKQTAKDYDILLNGTAGGELKDPEAQIDKAAELQQKWQTASGQLWQAAEQRLLCGDCITDSENLLRNVKVDLVLTDPPYGVEYKGGYRSFDDGADQTRQLISQLMPMLRRWPVVLLTSGHRLMWDYPRPDWVLVWVHPAGMGRGPWGFTGTNPILAYGKDPYLAKGLGSRPDSLVLAADREGVEGHPAPKPIKVWAWLMERGSVKPNDVIFDPFCGSGTTLVAAHQLHRKGYGIELDPSYCAVALQRLADLGLTPKLLNGPTS